MLKAIVFDYNGTLVDDLDLAVDSGGPSKIIVNA